MDLSKVILDKNLLKKKLLFTKNVSTERQTEMPFNLKKKKKNIEPEEKPLAQKNSIQINGSLKDVLWQENTRETLLMYVQSFSLNVFTFATFSPRIK